MTGTLAYNDKGQLTKYTCTHNDNDFPYPAVTELIYDGKEKPQKMYFWSVWEDYSLPSTGTYYFHYDEKGRLIIVDGVSALGTSGRRFEYDKNDNVIKVFLIHFDRTEELLTEFLTFDSKPNLYEQVPELKMINIYSEFNIPNKNNVLTAKVFRDPKDPLLVTFEPTYDGRGLIIGNRQLNDGITGLAEFSEVTRDCQ